MKQVHLLFGALQNIEILQYLLEAVLRETAGVAEAAWFGFPVLQAAVVEGFQIVRDDEGNDAAAQAFLEQQQAAVTAVAVLEGVDALEAVVEVQQIVEGYDGYIANADGKPLNDANFRRHFNSLLSQANVQHCGLHALRHTFASYYYEYTNGSRKLVADYLGHSISNLTERVYATTSDRIMEQSIRDFVI